MTTGSDRALRVLGPVVGVLLVVGLLAVGFLPPAVLVLSVPFLVIAARRPVLRRLALRNAARRPRETALIILGALLGTAIITGSAVVGDTFGSSIRRNAFTQLGPIDEIVRAADLAALPPVLEAVRSIDSDDIDGVLPILAIGATVATPGSDETRRAEPGASVVELDFAEAREFGGDAGATGIDGPTPAPGKVVINEDLARTLRVDAGDRVEVFAYGATQGFEVDRVIDRLGLAGFRLGFGSASPNVFVPPGTIAALVAGNPAAGAPPGAFVAVSNTGGVIDGADRSFTVRRTIEDALAARQLTASADMVKKGLLDAADAQGASFTQLFSSIGFFSVIAGILLLVSIFVMLAEERKTELGMLRAVGLRRSGLIGFFSLEGWMYSMASAALGTIAGLGVGRVIVFVTSGIFRGNGQFALELQYAPTLASVQRGFLTGFVMSLLTVVITSVVISRLNVIRAIRDLPEPTEKTTSGARLLLRVGLRAALAAGGGLLSLAGVSGASPALILTGPPIAALGLAALLRLRLNKRIVDSVAAAFALFWAIACFDLFPSTFRNPDISLFVADGVILTVAAVLLVSRHQELIGRGVRTVGGGSRSMALRLGLAYPLARTFRTSIILLTFALTMFTLTSITLFSGSFGSQVEEFTKDASGGFDVTASSNASNPAPLDAVRAEPGVEAVAGLATLGAQFNLPSRDEVPGQTDYQFWGLSGFDAAFVEQGPPALDKFPPEYKTSDDAWAGVLADPSLIIVNDFFLQGEGGPPTGSVEIGETVLVRDPVSGATKDLKVGAISGGGGFGGMGGVAYMGIDGVRAIVGQRAVPNVLFVATSDDVDAQVVAERLNAKYLANGVDAISFRKAVSDGLAQQQQFFGLMQGYLALGLVVGVAGLGVVMVRAVRERRREVGVLRSLGFETRQVRRAFVAESTFVGVEGILIGTVLAMVSTWRLLNSGAFGDGIEFAIPWVQVSAILLLAFVATLVATASPAQQASKIRPAVALRIAD